jgi:ribosomal 50S subunit-associated protein YjgA (DUF615 family)
MTIERKPGSLTRPGSGKHAALPARVLPDLTPRDSMDDMNDGDNPWSEHTPITDAAGLYRKVGQTAKMAQALVDTTKTVIDKLPQIEGKVDIAIEAARNAQREAFEAKNAVTLVQQRVEDVCKRVECLEPLKVNGAAREVRLTAVEDQLEKGAERRWGVWMTIVGIILTVLGSIGASIWWARGVDAATVHEAQVREASDKVLIEHVERRPTRDEVLTEEKLRNTLRDELSTQRQVEVQAWINSFPPAKRAALRKLVGDTPTGVQ